MGGFCVFPDAVDGNGLFEVLSEFFCASFNEDTLPAAFPQQISVQMHVLVMVIIIF